MKSKIYSYLKEVLRFAIATLAGYLAGGCAFVPVLQKGVEC